MYRFAIFYIIFLLSSVNALGASLSIEIGPPEIMKNQTFYMTFTISTEDEEEPNISFYTNDANVISKTNQGVVVKTTIINGKFSRSRELTYTFAMEPKEDVRNITIKNIAVKLKKETLTHRDIKINIGNTPQKSLPFFALAVPSKKNVYLHEGFNVNYYLYKSAEVLNQEIAGHPKLESFLKRLNTGQGASERVYHNNRSYVRILLYSVRLFPNKVGKLVLDPIKLRIQYARGGRENPFSVFGFGLRNVKRSHLRTPTVKINVLPLPTKNKPKNFTNLVGDHEFSLKMNKNKFIVNEPIEFTLEAKGTGALELFEAPPIFQNGNLEEFEKTSNFQLEQNNRASKKFSYTYLTSGPLIFKQKKLELSYFNPKKKDYVIVKLPIESFRVAGGEVTKTGQVTDYKTQDKTKKSTGSSPQVDPKILATGALGPIFSYGQYSMSNMIKINYILSLILLIFLGYIIYFKIVKGQASDEVSLIIKKIKDTQGGYGPIFQLVSILNTDEKNLNHVLLDEIIEVSDLSHDAKSYFKEIIDVAEKRHFKGKISRKPFQYESKFFDEFARIARAKESKVL